MILLNWEILAAEQLMTIMKCGQKQLLKTYGCVQRRLYFLWYFWEKKNEKKSVLVIRRVEIVTSKKISNKADRSTNGPKRTLRSNGLWKPEPLISVGSNRKIWLVSLCHLVSEFQHSTMVPQALSVPASASFTIASRTRSPSHLVFSHRFIFISPNETFTFFPIVFFEPKIWATIIPETRAR